MLICKYTRKENAVFVPHLDTLRAVTMAIRRIGARAEYSAGFNPHMKIFFGQPIPIGTESDCEYFCVYANESPSDFMRRLNESLPFGLCITAAAEIQKDPNVANLMYYADYTVTMRREESNLLAAEKFAAGRQCEISYIVKGERVYKDVKELICSVQAENPRTLRLRLRCGNRNLRADRLMRFWADSFGWGSYDVVKTNTYDENGVNLDKILFGSDK